MSGLILYIYIYIYSFKTNSAKTTIFHMSQPNKHTTHTHKQRTKTATNGNFPHVRAEEKATRGLPGPPSRVSKGQSAGPRGGRRRRSGAGWSLSSSRSGVWVPSSFLCGAFFAWYKPKRGWGSTDFLSPGWWFGSAWRGCPARCPFCYPFFGWEGSPTIDYRKKLVF